MHLPVELVDTIAGYLAANLLDVLHLQARQLDTRFELIGIRNDRLANRVALHLALGGGFVPPPAP